MRAPRFWQNKNSKRALLLNPLGQVYAYFSARRLKRTHPYQAKMPVLCVGNLSVGGVGKTPVCLALGKFLRTRGKKFYYLNHGYKARQQSVLVDMAVHSALDVGDEALLLATDAPTIVDSARARGAQLAEHLGADCLIMDDGFQNPSLVKTLSFVVVDGWLGFGNERVMPAGPLREPVLKGLQRADALILIGQDKWGVQQYLDKNKIDLPVLTGTFLPNPTSLKVFENAPKIGAFAGIGHPEKFFNMLKNLGIELQAEKFFPDHYFYTRFDIDSLKKEYPDYVWATTCKDWVKLPRESCAGIHAVEGDFQFDEPEKLAAILGEVLG